MYLIVNYLSNIGMKLLGKVLSVGLFWIGSYIVHIKLSLRVNLCVKKVDKIEISDTLRKRELDILCFLKLKTNKSNFST